MQHSDGLADKANTLIKLLAQIGTKITSTKLQNTKHKLTGNRQMEEGR